MTLTEETTRSTRIKRRYHHLLLALSVATGGTACETPPGASDGDSAAIEKGTRELFFWDGATPWANGTIPVCWTATSMARPDFAQRAVQVRNLLDNSWPAVANVDFTGWGACPAGADTMNIARITMDNSMAASSGGHGQGPRHVGLGTARGDFGGGLIPHEFGHVLGFPHEINRVGFVDDAAGTCRDSNDFSGDGLFTAADRQSIMVSTGYCNNNTQLSLWDAKGVRAKYGRRVNGFSPLTTAYHFGREDHGTIATDVSNADVQNAGYNFAYPDGWLFDTQVEGTVPLKLYWNAERSDLFTVATSQSEADAVAAGYAFVRNEGFIYPTQQPGTVALNLYWHAGRRDTFTTASAAGAAAATGAGYTLVRTEGYVFANVPYSVLWVYWSAARQDNLHTAQNSALAAAAETSNYGFAGFDAAVLKFQVPGTVPLKTFWSSARGDHFATATADGEQAALAAGYIFVREEGYVYSSQSAGTLPMRSYWHAGREDNMTTVGRGAIALGAGYLEARVEGYAFSTVD